MSAATVPTLTAIALQLVLALAVFQANPKRRLNQGFFLLSLGMVGWLASLHFAVTATNPAMLEFWIRQASVAGALILCMFNLLRLSVRDRDLGWRNILGRSRVWLIATGGIVALCQTGFFLKAATHPLGSAAPIPVYGDGVFLYTAFFVATIAAHIISTWRDLRSTSGAEHAELAFILIGGFSALIFPLLLSFILGLFIEPERLLWFAPFRVIFSAWWSPMALRPEKSWRWVVLSARPILCTSTAYLLALSPWFGG